MSTVSSKVTGKVLEIYVEEGMAVLKDQIVAKLDSDQQPPHDPHACQSASSTPRVAISPKSKCGWRTAKRNLERNEALVKQSQLVSQTALDTTRAEYNAPAGTALGFQGAGQVCRKASSRCASSTSTTLNVRAPFAGVVIRRMRSPAR